MAAATGRRGRWEADELRTELEEFVADRADWPTAPEFVAAGRQDLRCAVKRHGGATYWARELGKTLRPGQERSPYGEREALRDARTLVGQLGHVPGQRRARSLGFPRFATYLGKSGGAREFARQFGFAEAPNRRY